jgi:predicted dehydrogenase/threonine dehydrogenase-like Zn-dependent dehydrogenase
MKQVIQSLKTGTIEVAEVPVPRTAPGTILIRTSRTLISAGTERMLLDFGRGGWIAKARQQPDKVRMVLNKAKTDGIAATVASVRNKLDQPMPLGYCNVGRVVEVGPGVSGIAVGDRVVSNGKHAEFVAVPTNLCAKVPDGVSDEDAVFTVAAAIALQGIRLAEASLGASVAVFGLGLLGLLTVQLLRAQGCRVIGFDFSADRLALAEKFGAETSQLSEGSDPVAAGLAFSRGRGVDAALITAATDSNDPVRQAAQMSRKRGRVVLVGVAGLDLSRADFYEKELTFQVSCSYGPGRYDPVYEEKGIDYPVGFVRWTEQRNFEAVLDLMGALNLAAMRTHEFEISAAPDAYDIVGGAEPSLAVLLRYPESEAGADVKVVPVMGAERRNGQRSTGLAASCSINIVGAGNYASAILVPAFAESGADLNAIGSSSGLTAVNLARRHGIREASSDTRALIVDPEANTVVITTRHDSHAALTCDALRAGKNVFVEKPLALTDEEVSAVESAYDAAPGNPILMVGFNRRFAPLIVKARTLIDRLSGPKSFVYTVNAGAIPPEHWTQDREIGGGRIIGEACHFIDLLLFLAGSPVADFSSVALESRTGDTVSIGLAFQDGSIGTIHYFANGSRSFPKERLEVFGDGRTLRMDNFRKLETFGWPRGMGARALRQDKGQTACVKAFVEAVRRGGPAPIGPEELFDVARLSIAIADQAKR